MVDVNMTKHMDRQKHVSKTGNHFTPIPFGNVGLDASATVDTSASRSATTTTMKTCGPLYVAVRAVFRLLFIIANNLYCIPTHAIWMFLLLPVLHFSPALFWYIEGPIFKVLLLMVAAWTWTAGYKYYEVGEDVSSCYNQECLVLANHQSTGDVPSLMTAFQNKGRVVDDMMWIMDYMFKYTNFGLVSWIHGDFFIRAGRSTRQSELVRVRDHMLKVYTGRRRKWVVLFPEGGFLRKRLETSQRYAKKNNLPVLEHVTLPRIGALHAIVNALHPKTLNTGGTGDAGHSDKKAEPLKWIIDITIGYPGGEPIGLDSIICMLAEPRNIFLHYRRFPIEEVPLDEDGMTEWLYQRFQEKEVLLREFYRTGSFPVLTSSNSRLLDKPQPVEFDNTYIATMHVLFILSTAFHWWLFSCLLALLWPF